jgi:NAD(P)-dependent dehydrogenase (short-subunit alcohol dehydrogenase family)
MNPFFLTNKTILVTGASSGIGRSVSIECSKLGANVVITGRNEERLRETLTMMDGDNNQIIVCDLTKPDELEKLVAEVPMLDGLSNNAGIHKTMLIKHLSYKQLFEIMNINTYAPIMLTTMLIKKKRINNPASIVYTSALAGIYNVHYGDALNACSKGALNAFSKSAALDLSQQGVRVNCVNPGVITTESLMSGSVLTDDELKGKEHYFPLKRFGKPEDVAHSITYLLSDASSWITGVNIPIDGGYSIL